MLGTLESVRMNYFDGAGLFGCLLVQLADGERRMYTLCPPSAADPNPAGWSSIEQLTGVTAVEVSSSWPEPPAPPVVNVKFEQALERLQAHIGTRFLIEEETGPYGRVVHLTAFPAAASAAASSGGATESPATDSATVHWMNMTGENAALQLVPTDGGTTFLVLSVVEGPGYQVEPLAFRLPDLVEHTPEDWWILEAVTGIAAARVVSGWDRKKNTVADDVVRLLAPLIAQQPAPFVLACTGGGDGRLVYRFEKDLFRRELFRRRWATGRNPFVFVGRPQRVISATQTILLDLRSDELFRMDETPVQMIQRDGRWVARRLVDTAEVGALLHETVNYAKASARRIPEDAWPARQLEQHLLVRPDDRWRRLHAVVRTPILRPDGTVLDKPGYDAQTHFWYAPDPGIVFPPVPAEPTTEDVRRARIALKLPLCEFPFFAESDRTAAIAMLFDQIVLPMILGNRPLYFFDAPAGAVGSGKSTIPKIWKSVLTGVPGAASPIGTSEEEIQKQITGTLVDNRPPVIVFDNLTGVVASAALCALATTTEWTARILGQSKMPAVPNTTTWAMTGNGARLSQDIARRCVLIRLNPPPEAFRRTDFAIPNIERYGVVHRAELIHAALVLARAWVVAGRPKDPNPDMILGSFESWVETVPAILAHAGFASLAPAVRAANARDQDKEELLELALRWRERADGQPSAAIALALLAVEYGLLEGPLLRGRDRPPTNPAILGKRMAQVLEKYLGHVLVDRRLVRHAHVVNGCRVYGLELVN